MFGVSYIDIFMTTSLI